MARSTLAPWGELVPDAAPMTPEELFDMPQDSQWRYELVEGRLVRMPPPGGEHGDIAANLLIALGGYVKARRLGRVLAAETGFQLGPDDVLAADVAFVRAERVPARDSDEWAKYWRLAPDLVAEVVSPSQKRDDAEAKARAWLTAGVRLVWVVWPKTQQVDVWQSGGDRPVAALGMGESLDGHDVVPSFSFPLADLFA